MNSESLENRTIHFIKRAKAMHGEKFDYSQTEYIHAKSKVKIICPIHGDFLQTPDKHLAKNSKGCQKCWSDIRIIMVKNIHKERKNNGKPPLKKIVSGPIFLEKCKITFGNKFSYDMENYNGLVGNEISITCPNHGVFLMQPRAHLLGHGCKDCAKVKFKESMTFSYDNAVQQFNEKFNFEYDYPESNRVTYKNKKSIIEVICKTHGPFIKKAQKHLTGQGCFQCRVEEMIRTNVLVGGYSEELFTNKPEIKDCPAFLYYLRINDGQFYKIGISRVSIDNRIKSAKSKARRYNETIEIDLVYSENATLYECFLKEQSILNQFNYCRVFKPWSTELFSENVLKIT